MMTAKEAFDISSKAKLCQDDYTLISNKIRESVENGYYKCIIPNIGIKSSRVLLQRAIEPLGYDITMTPSSLVLSWETLIPEKFKKLKDKELVWCWDNTDITERILCFFDTENNSTFCNDGRRNSGDTYDNYIPYEGIYPDWVKEALMKLED